MLNPQKIDMYLHVYFPIVTDYVIPMFIPNELFFCPCIFQNVIIGSIFI